MHEHFDAEGEPCIAMYAFTTVVTREPEWDESSRGRVMQLAEHERSTDKQTGLPIEVAYDPDQMWRVDFTTNFAARAVDRVRKAHSELPENKDKADWSSGRTYYAEPVDPADEAPAEPGAPDPDERTPQ